MPSRLSADEAMVLHAIATVEQSPLDVHRTTDLAGYLEIGVAARGRLLIMERDGRVLEWPPDGDPRAWPTDPTVASRLRTMFPAVERRLRAALDLVNEQLAEQGVRPRG